MDGQVVLITVHAMAATVAVLLGPVNLLRRTKGDHAHRVVGRVWVVAMYVVVLSAFGLWSDGFTIFHALAILTFTTLTLGLRAAVRGDIPNHRANMTGSYLGLLGAFVGAIAVPDRRIPQLAVHHPYELVAYAAACLTICWLVVARAGVRLSRSSGPPRSSGCRAGATP